MDPRTTEETEAALLDAAEEDEDDEDWGALDRTVMEELARGFDENTVDPKRREEGTLLTQTLMGWDGGHVCLVPISSACMSSS